MSYYDVFMNPPKLPSLDEILASIPRTYEQRIITDDMPVGTVTGAGTVVRCPLCELDEPNVHKGAIPWRRTRRVTEYAHTIDITGGKCRARVWCEWPGKRFTESKR